VAKKASRQEAEASRQEAEKTKPRKTPEPRAPSLLPPPLLSPYHTPTQPSHDTSNGGAEHGNAMAPPASPHLMPAGQRQ
jgi:hypothetical protein